MEVHLAVYENGWNNNEWKEIENDYTNHVSPADIESMNGISFYIITWANGMSLDKWLFPMVMNCPDINKIMFIKRR